MTSPDRQLDWLHTLRTQIDQEITLLTLRAIADRVCTKLPDAALVGLAPTNYYDTYRVPAGYFTADGQRIREAGDDAWEIDLDDAIFELTSRLDETNSETWSPFTRQSDDHGHLLVLQQVLASTTTSDTLTLQIHDAAVICTAADSDSPHSDTYCLDVHGVSVLVRRRANGCGIGTYVHIDTEHITVPDATPILLEVEVDNAGAIRYQS